MLMWKLQTSTEWVAKTGVILWMYTIHCENVCMWVMCIMQLIFQLLISDVFASFVLCFFCNLCCFQQVSDMHSHLLSCLYLDLLRLNLSTVHNLSLPSCNNSILLLPQVALPNIFPSIMSWSKLSCLRTCPSRLSFLHQIVFSVFLPSLSCTSPSSFITFSVQLLFSILHPCPHFKCFQRFFTHTVLHSKLCSF